MGTAIPARTEMDLREAVNVCRKEGIWPDATYPMIWRACRKGVTSASGARLKITHTRRGGKLYLTREAIIDFISALNESDRQHFDTEYPASPNPRETQRRVAKLKQEAAAI